MVFQVEQNKPKITRVSFGGTFKEKQEKSVTHGYFVSLSSNSQDVFGSAKDGGQFLCLAQEYFFKRFEIKSQY